MSNFITVFDFDGDGVFVNVDHIAYIEHRLAYGTRAVTGSIVKMVGPVGHQIINTPTPMNEIIDMIAGVLALGRSGR